MQSKNVLHYKVSEGFSKPFSSTVLESSSFMGSSVTKTIRWNKNYLNNSGPTAIFFRTISDSTNESVIIAGRESLGESVRTTGLPLIPTLSDLDDEVTTRPLTMRRSNTEAPQASNVSADTKPSVREVEMIEVDTESSSTSDQRNAASSSATNVEPMEVDSPASAVMEKLTQDFMSLCGMFS